MKTWNFAVIGCGSVAETHFKAIEHIEQAKLVMVASRTESRVRKIAEEKQCEWTVNIQDVLERPDIDIVCVTTSSGSHAEIGKQVIQAGKHLLVEKPIAMTYEEAAELIELAKQHQVTLSVISQNRYKDHIRYVKQVIDEGKLGRLVLLEAFTPYYRDQAYYDSADWRGTIKEDGGALMNQGIHYIDLLLWFGGEVSTVIGKTDTMLHQMEAEDIGLAILRFKQGALGTIMASTNCKPGYPQSIHIYGERGSIRLTSQEITEWSVDGVAKPEFGQKAPTPHGGSDPRNLSFEDHRRQMLDLMTSIENGAQPVVTGQCGANAVRCVQQIYASSASKQEVPF